MFKIVADENIPHVENYFGSLGQIKQVNGRQLKPEQLQDADVLLVRSVTKVDEALLSQAAIKFVGTATIGIDHLDVNFLEQQGIAWANAPGCNADSVVDYIYSCFASIEGLWQRLFNGASVGIVGRGNVGGRLQQRLQALGVTTLAYDPLLEPTPLLSHDLNAVLNCDVVCMHTPLTKTGNYPSYHMLAKCQLEKLKHGAVLINAGRGAAIDNLALQQYLQQRPDVTCVLDVWEGEPVIAKGLLPFIHLATPHIAGYSFDGKVRGTQMIYQACCEALAIKPAVHGDGSEKLSLELVESGDDLSSFSAAIQAVYDVKADDRRFRLAMNASNTAVEQAEAFDGLRKYYPERREFSCYQVLSDSHSHRLNQWLAATGFQLG